MFLFFQDWEATEISADLYKNVQYFKNIRDIVIFLQKAVKTDTEF